MPEVTIIMVYQNSQPWLEVACAALDHFKNDIPVKYIFVENHPTTDGGPAAVNRFMAGKDAMKLIGHPPPCFDGRAHSYGLDLAFPHVTTEWTLFIDADIVILKDHWLAELMSHGCDMVGPECDSGLNDYSLPILHPCLLLFRTRIAKLPYWNQFFASWGPGDVEKVSLAGGTWDVCRPFTYHIGINPELKQKKLPNLYCQEFIEGKQVYFVIGSYEAPLAAHLREGSQSIARHHGDTRHVLIEHSHIFKWYKGNIEAPTQKHGYD